MALAATIYAIVNMEHAGTILERLRSAQEPSLWGAFTGALDAVWRKLEYPVRLAKLFGWVTERGVVDQIVRFPNCQVKQTARAYKAKGLEDSRTTRLLRLKVGLMSCSPLPSIEPSS